MHIRPTIAGYVSPFIVAAIKGRGAWGSATPMRGDERAAPRARLGRCGSAGGDWPRSRGRGARFGARVGFCIVPLVPKLVLRSGSAAAHSACAAAAARREISYFMLLPPPPTHPLTCAQCTVTATSTTRAKVPNPTPTMVAALTALGVAVLNSNASPTAVALTVTRTASSSMLPPASFGVACPPYGKDVVAVVVVVPAPAMVLPPSTPALPLPSRPSS